MRELYKSVAFGICNIVRKTAADHLFFKYFRENMFQKFQKASQKL